MVDFLPRLKEILNWTGLGPTVFADEIGVARPIISHIFSGRNRISLDVVQKILIRFTEISPSWLMLGNGEMLKPLGNFEEHKTSFESSARNPTYEVSEPPAKEDQENVQKERPAESGRDDLPMKASKQISRIVIFYKDGSFESFEKFST